MKPIAEELLKTQVQTNTTHSCPLTVDDVNNARKMFGKLMHALKSNCVGQQLKEEKNNVLVAPQMPMANNHKTELCMDSVTVNCMSFLYSTEKTVKCHQMTHMPRTKDEDHLKALDDVLWKCNKARFVVAVIHCG